jgi:hypothetical protein
MIWDYDQSNLGPLPGHALYMYAIFNDAGSGLLLQTQLSQPLSTGSQKDLIWAVDAGRFVPHAATTRFASHGYSYFVRGH